MDPEAFALARRVVTLDQQLATLLSNGLDSLLVQRALSMVSVNYNALTADPLTPKDGTIWYRSDLNAFRLRINGTTSSLVAGTFNTVANDTIWDAKGDLVAGTGADAAARLPVGADTRILMADSSQATGLKWQATPQTRITNLQWDDAGTFTRASDTHGSTGGFGTHLDGVDGTDRTIRFAPVAVPTDFSGTMSLQLVVSSRAGNGNHYVRVSAYEIAPGFDGLTTLYENNPGAAIANNATANVTHTLEYVFGSLGGTTSPTIAASPNARVIIVTVGFLMANALDTVNADRTLWHARLKHVPTL